MKQVYLILNFIQMLLHFEFTCVIFVTNTTKLPNYINRPKSRNFYQSEFYVSEKYIKKNEQ